MTDGLYKLPSGWRWVRLGEVATKPQYGYTYAAISEPAGPKFLRITDIQDSSVEWEKVPYCRCNAPALEKYKLTSGDLLFARSGATTGKTFLVSNLPYEAIFASYLIRLKPHITELLPEFAFWFFQSRQYWEQIRPRGAAQPNMNAQALQRLILPLPCLAEQHRIVSKVEALMDRVHEAKRLRAAAFYEAELLIQAALKEIFPGPRSSLPDAWSSQELGDVCEIVPGQHILSDQYSDHPNGIPYITGPADFGTKYPTVSKWTESPKAFCAPGDVLLTVKGAGVGKVNCSPPDTKVCIGRQIMAVRPKPSYLVTDFLYYFLRTQFETIQGMGQSATVPGIRKEHVMQFRIPLPPIAAQCSIVAYFDSIQAQAAALKHAQEDTNAELRRLEQAILDRAFRGEL